ncbi:DUF6040 family protein [Butyrivibrio sp. XPD2002]|uniref:DUF6040 family protein n=1 Tax=Butyrivibrio sp. XPD2002 TaxID=1280665 RepID=UPI0012DC62EC|nr:DUF6040 family protein [Butyrivibrio sp. XPD2002]
MRNNAGLKSRKEQEKLEKDLADTQALLSDTQKKVDMSNVSAVEEALAAQEAAELKAQKDISDYKKLADGKITEAIQAKIEANKNAKYRVDILRKRERIAWESLAATLFCCLMAYPAFLKDIGDALTVPFVWAWNSLIEFVKWLERPCYSKYINGVEKLYAYSFGMAWFLRIASTIFTAALIAGICYGIWITVRYYRDRWCSLSLRVLLVSIGTVILFGESIHKIMNINLVVLLILLQGIYLGVIIYLDIYFENQGKSRYWDKMQKK